MFLAKSHRQCGGDAESRVDDRPQAADRRAAARRSGSSATAWSAPAAPSSCVDTVGAGQGEMVLIVQGSSARLTPETEKLPVDATIIGIVDTVNVENKTIFSARIIPLAGSGESVGCSSLTRLRSPRSDGESHHASHRRTDPQRGAAKSWRTCATARRRRRRATARRRDWGVFDDVDDAVAAAAAAQREFEAPRPRRPPQGRRSASADICTEQAETARPRGAGRNQDRPAGTQDRKAQSHRRPHPRRRVPAHRRLQRRERHRASGIRPVRRHRRHHAGDALAADAGLQRHQHARRPATPWCATRTPAGRTSPARACACSTRRSTRPSASTTCITIIEKPTLESAQAIFDHRDVRMLCVTGGPAVGRAALRSPEAGHRRRAGQSAGRRG